MRCSFLAKLSDVQNCVMPFCPELHHPFSLFWITFIRNILYKNYSKSKGFQFGWIPGIKPRCAASCSLSLAPMSVPIVCWLYPFFLQMSIFWGKCTHFPLPCLPSVFSRPRGREILSSSFYQHPYIISRWLWLVSLIYDLWAHSQSNYWF